MHSEAGNRVDTHSTSPARATVALRRERVVCQAVYYDPCYVMACGCATYALLATITSHNTSAGLVCRVRRAAHCQLTGTFRRRKSCVRQ